MSLFSSYLETLKMLLIIVLSVLCITVNKLNISPISHIALNIVYPNSDSLGFSLVELCDCFRIGSSLVYYDHI